MHLSYSISSKADTGGRYSTVWLARALPADGHIITLEISEHHAKVNCAIIIIATILVADVSLGLGRSRELRARRVGRQGLGSRWPSFRFPGQASPRRTVRHGLH